MRLDDFDFILPPDLIAQNPTVVRDSSRLMTLSREDCSIGELPFSGIVDLLREGDLLVVNDTRVIPARIMGHKESGGRVEVFLVRKTELPGEVWQCLLRASKPPGKGALILLPEGVTASVEGRADRDLWIVSFLPIAGFVDWLERVGSMPLPPYIRRDPTEPDRERYQTVYARERGAVAAPTAGLHFTNALMEEVQARGVEIVSLTLHVGLGTFLPVRVEDIREHRMHCEYFRIPDNTSAAVAARKKGKGRVIAVGTTVARALEQAASKTGAVESCEGEADIFIYPGYQFRVVDALITNFHLPKSTLLLLVSAFAGKEFLYNAYVEAVRKKFRFYSYGDAMFIY